MAYRVVADHIRTLSFAIADGASPGTYSNGDFLLNSFKSLIKYGDHLSHHLSSFSFLEKEKVSTFEIFEGYQVDCV